VNSVIPRLIGLKNEQVSTGVYEVNSKLTIPARASQTSMAVNFFCVRDDTNPSRGSVLPVVSNLLLGYLTSCTA
jgi:hypothetical protein